MFLLLSSKNITMNPKVLSHKHFALSRAESIDVMSQLKIAREKNPTDLQASDIVIRNYLLKQTKKQKECG